MGACNICGKRIKEVHVTIAGQVYDVNVCAKCLHPYIVEEPDRAKKRLLQNIHRKAYTKKGNSSRK